MKRLICLCLLVSCRADDDELDERERDDCESFFIAASYCMERVGSDEEDAPWETVSSCLRACSVPGDWCAQWPSNERAEFYAEQLDDDCDLFALRWQETCVAAVGDIDDEELRWTVKRQLYDACVAVYLEDAEIPPAFETCSSGPEFTLAPVQLCE